MYNEVTTAEQELRDFMLKFDYNNDREVRYIPKGKALSGTTAYLSVAEMAQLSDEVNDAGVVLMTFYFRKIKTPKYDFFNDKAVAKSLGWTEKKVQTTRQKLCKAGWMKRIKMIQPTTRAKMTVFYIGKEACNLIETAEEYNARIAQEQA